MAKKEKRFIVVAERADPTTKIIVDKETGVNYLWMTSGYGGGLTPLLDMEGKPIITKEI